jgi:hypothetical protein
VPVWRSSLSRGRARHTGGRTDTHSSTHAHTQHTLYDTHTCTHTHAHVHAVLLIDRLDKLLPLLGGQGLAADRLARRRLLEVQLRGVKRTHSKAQETQTHMGMSDDGHTPPSPHTLRWPWTCFPHARMHTTRATHTLHTHLIERVLLDAVAGEDLPEVLRFPLRCGRV